MIATPTADVKKQKGTAPTAPVEQPNEYDVATLVARINKSFEIASEQLKAELKHIADERRYLAEERRRLDEWKSAQHTFLIAALEKEAGRLICAVEKRHGEIIPVTYEAAKALVNLKNKVTTITPKIVLINIALPAIIGISISTAVFVFAPIIARLMQ